MNAAARPVFYDPFFDGSDAYGRGGSGMPSNMPNDFIGYRSPHEETFTTAGLRGDQMFGPMAGRPLASVLRPTFKGDTTAPTVIIPHANEGGVPYGVAPNVLEGVRVVIDPHIPQQSAELDLGQARNFAADALHAAEAMLPTIGSSRDRRLRASAAYHLIAKAEHDGSVASELPVSPDPEDYRVNEKERQNGVQVEQPRIPMQMHIHGEKQAAARPQRAIVAQPVPQPSLPPSGGGRAIRSLTQAAMRQQAPQPQVAATQQLPPATTSPKVRVHFEMQLYNHAQQPVTVDYDSEFDDVQLSKDNSCILLAMRQGANVWLPPDGENAPDVAVQIAGGSTAYLVQAMPIRYVFQGYELIQLIIKQSGPVEG